jgi:hypothetical protein
MPEKITDQELLRDIVWNDADGYRELGQEHAGTSRWHQSVNTIFRRISDGKLFMANWRKAATEMQEHEYPDEAVECEAYTETVIKYRRL